MRKGVAYIGMDLYVAVGAHRQLGAKGGTYMLI